MSQDTASPPANAPPSLSKGPEFPPSNSPRVWLLTDGLSPVAVDLARRLIEHGDYVIAGILQEEYDGMRGEALRTLQQESEVDATGDEGAGSGSEKSKKDRLKVVELDGRYAAVADIELCANHCLESQD